MTYKKSYFFISDAFGLDVFEGYTRGESWNGWAVPYFEKDVALKILEKCNDYQSVKYNKDKDSMELNYTGLVEDLEVYDGEEIMVGDRDAKMVWAYPIGANSWIWEELANAKKFTDDEHFGGDVVLNFVREKNGDIYVDLWVYSDIPYYWNLTVDGEGIYDHETLLSEIKKETYVTEGYSETF